MPGATANEDARAANEMELSIPEVARRIYQSRRLRDREFDDFGPLFRDPAWDMMLDLYLAWESGHPISSKSAAIAANVPTTTALRVISDLVALGLVRRVTKPEDRRLSMIELSDLGRGRMLSTLALTGARWNDRSS